MRHVKTTIGLALALAVLLAAAPAFAQLQTGNLYGTVQDEQGSPLPGVTVTLTGGGAPQVQVTNAQGQFRFLGLGPGSYALKAELEGFSTVDYPNITINVGRNTEIEVTMSGAVEDVITVTAESPLLDERRITTGATVASTELEKIPTARDPWAILQTTPGVLTDRINVGGNESGQQSQYVGPGSGGDQAVWSVDGVVITDMAALGSSPAYYDFDAFEEMQVTTGGSDSTIATGGVVLNMVTKRGTNEWRGSGRYETDRDGAFGILPEQADLSHRQLRAGQGRRVARRLRRHHPAGRLQPGQPDRRRGRLRRRGRRSDRQGPAVDLGLLRQAEDRPAHDRRRQRLHRPRDQERQAQRADRVEQLGDGLRLRQRQGEDRPQRRSDPSAGDDLEPGQVRAQADRLEDRGHAHLLLELLPDRHVLEGQRRLPAGPAGRSSTTTPTARRRRRLAQHLLPRTRPSVRRTSSRPTPRASSTPATCATS